MLAFLVGCASGERTWSVLSALGRYFCWIYGHASRMYVVSLGRAGPLDARQSAVSMDLDWGRAHPGKDSPSLREIE